MLLKSLVALCIAHVVYTQCHTKVYEEPGNVMFAVMLSVRRSTGFGECGEVSLATLQHVLAVKYAVLKLNTVDSSGKKYIPGVNFGFTVFNDCGDPYYASQHAYNILGRTSKHNISDCPEAPAFTAGVIGPSRSSTTAAVAEILNRSGLPIITLATLPAFSNATLYPNVLRTVTSDLHQTKAIINLMKELGWTRFSLIYSSDNYGESGAAELLHLAYQEKICANFTISLNNLHFNPVQDLFGELKKSADSGSVGVVYMGQREAAQFILKEAHHHEGRYPFLASLLWIMSDSVGTNMEAVTVGESLSDGILTMSSENTPIQEFIEFARNQLLGRNSSVPWVKSYTDRYCSKQDSCKSFHQQDYVGATLDAVYVLGAAVKKAHHKRCGTMAGVCDKLHTGNPVLDEVKGISFSYSSTNRIRYPPEFSQRRVRFDAKGDIIHPDESHLYNINLFWKGSFHHVGSYSKTSMELSRNEIHQKGHGGIEVSFPNLMKSTCLTVCKECHKIQHFIYVPGDYLIVAFFSIHESSKTDPFGCGAIRTTTNTIPSVEAFLYMFKEKAKMNVHPRMSLGVVIFDECYNPLKSNSIISDFLSGNVELVDEVTGEMINRTKVVAVIGPEPSSVALPQAQCFSRLNLPQVSYAASSPDLDDRFLYPFFLRTVPSDEVQADLMVKVIKAMGWKYINIVYTNNIYGKTGMKKIQIFAEKEGVCVANPIAINEIPEHKDLQNVIKILGINKATAVVFFGTGDSARRLLQTLRTSNIHNFTFVASEDWGVNMKPIDGLELEAAGSLTVTVDTSMAENNKLREYLLMKAPSKTDINPWFSRFWQDQFKCNLPWSFNKKHDVDCDLSVRIDEKTVESMINDQRIVHAMNSIAAVVNGLVAAHFELCSDGPLVGCDKFRLFPERVTEHIRNTTLFSAENVRFRPFRDDGNGDIGYRIHNLHRGDDGNYYYVEVGIFDRHGLRMDLKRIKLYSGDADRSPVSSIDTTCLGPHCSMCYDSISDSRKSAESTEWKSVIIIITSLNCLVVLVISVVHLLWCSRYRLCDSTTDKGKFEQPSAITGPYPTGLQIENPSLSTTGSTSSAKMSSEAEGLSSSSSQGFSMGDSRSPSREDNGSDDIEDKSTRHVSLSRQRVRPDLGNPCEPNGPINAQGYTSTNTPRHVNDMNGREPYISVGAYV
ncbi:uncharacterized protein LOC135471244 isoform X2 [Liolophura sinensis]|uniref:uncharacterized protein LOC135471244 isoform X2 n=1 Tax=Liolophura sinensis TaxID=3198878 RepID=UPI003158E50D